MSNTNQYESSSLDSEIVDYLTRYAKAMKRKGHSQQIQSDGMKAIFDMILIEVYRD